MVLEISTDEVGMMEFVNNLEDKLDKELAEIGELDKENNKKENNIKYKEEMVCLEALYRVAKFAKQQYLHAQKEVHAIQEQHQQQQNHEKQRKRIKQNKRDIKCFVCNKCGHYVSECYHNHNNKKYKKKGAQQYKDSGKNQEIFGGTKRLVHHQHQQQ